MPRTIPNGSPHAARAIAVVLVAVLALWAPRASAAEGAPWPAIAGLEDRVDLAFMIDDPAGQLASGPGRALSRFVTESGLFDDTMAAWSHLADTLNVDAAELTQRLLSRRVTVLLDLDRPATLEPSLVTAERWAVLTEVDPETERWVRSRLKAAPRDALPGATVLAVEGGRFRMAVVKQTGVPTHLVLAPANSAALLERAVAFAREETPAAAQPELPLGDIVGFAQLDQLTGTPSTIYWSSTHADTGWHTNLFLRTDQPKAPHTGIGVNTFDALSRGAIASLAVNDPRDLSKLIAANANVFLTTPKSAREPMALSIFEAPEPSKAPLSLRLISRLPQAQDQPHNGPARFDDLVGAFLVPFIPDGASAASSFEGRFPAAVRTQDITIRTPLLSRWLGTSAQVAWRFAETTDQTFASVTCSPASASNAQDLTRRACQVIESIPEPGPPVVMGFVLRPAELVRTIGPTGSAASLRWLKELRVVLHEPHPALPTLSHGEMTLTTSMPPPIDPTQGR